MSDYIESQDYSMQLAAHEDDPFAYDWTKLREEVDEPLSALFADITPASLEEPIDVDANDWSDLNDALENGPWREVFHWPTEYQDAGAQPGDRCAQSTYSSTWLPPKMEVQPNDDCNNEVEPRFVCSHPQCSKTYKRKGDLTRHQKLHKIRRDFLCTAQACSYSFTRADKLRDHIRDGHDRDVLFACFEPRCQALLTKDTLSVHHGSSRIVFDSYRKCPLPGCGSYVKASALDNLLRHILEKHDFKGRERFASLIADRGYDYETAHIVCPMCSDRTLFSTHQKFGEHFADNHCGNSQRYGPWKFGKPGDWCYPREQVSSERRVYTSVTHELREHRRTILSLIPEFYDHPVWNDIKDCPHQV